MYEPDNSLAKWSRDQAAKANRELRKGEKVFYVHKGRSLGFTTINSPKYSFGFTGFDDQKGGILWAGKITVPAPKFHGQITNWTDEAGVVEAEPKFPTNSDGMW